MGNLKNYPWSFSHDKITINDGIWISLIDNSKSGTLCHQRNEAVQSSISSSNLALDSDTPSFLTNSISPINPSINFSTESGGIENGEAVNLDGTQIAPNIIRGKYQQNLEWSKFDIRCKISLIHRWWHCRLWYLYFRTDSTLYCRQQLGLSIWPILYGKQLRNP